MNAILNKKTIYLKIKSSFNFILKKNKKKIVILNFYIILFFKNKFNI